MKIILTRPKYETHLITPPLGLGYLSSYLKKNNFDCQIIDALKLNLSNQELVKKCKRVDVVGISVLSAYFLETIDLVKRLKKKGKIVIVGGPHATALPKVTLGKTGADFIIIGEGEISFLRLVRQLKKRKKKKEIKTRGIISHYYNKISFSPWVKDLSSLPFPDWESLDPRTYPKAPHGGVVKNFPAAPVLTTRGCPYECKFCASPFLWKRRIRFRKPKEVVKEIQYLVNNFGVKEIHFEDDNFTLKRSHAIEICQLILEKNIKISWATPNGIRADKVDLKLLKLMKKSGCYFVAFGIESGNQTILNNIAKHSNLKIIRKAAKLAHKAGLITQGFFIFGLPGETEQTIKETIEFAKKLPLDKAQFLLLDVIPGSALWKELRFDRKVNWSLDSFHEVSWLPPTVREEVLNKAPSRAFKEFFLRPKQFWTMFKMIKPEQLPFIIKRIKKFIV